MTAPRDLLASVLLAVGCLFSCQLVLGGFEVTDAPPESLIGGCKEGSLHCNDAWLFCESVKNGEFVLVDTCPSAAQCDSTLGACAVCNANDVRCNGAKLEVCNEDRTAWALIRECPTVDECNVNSRTCKACTPGEMPQCTGLELFECAEDQHWSSLGVCGTAELCQQSAIAIATDPVNTPRQCIEPACPTPGAYQCEADGLTLSRCAPDQTGWTPVDTCASEALCTLTLADPDAATARGSLCVPPVCVPADSYQCTGPVLERCRPDLTGWDQIDTCVDPYQCNTNQRACTGPCTPGDLQCSGAALEYCTDAQVWAHSEDCVNASLCAVAPNPDTGLFEGGCVDPVCDTPGEFQCNGAVLQRCYPDQTAWEDIESCRSSALCNAIDARCDPIGCEPAGGLQCNPENPSELRRCPEDLVMWESVTVCASTEACNTDPNGPSCVSQCPDPPVQCNGAVNELCSGITGQPVWTGQATCRTPELCQCGIDGTCNGVLAADGVCHDPVCGGTLGSTRCTGTNLETCQAGRNGWSVTQNCGSASMCLPGTYVNPFYDNGYCAVCSVGSERQCDGTTLRTCTSDRRAWMSSTTCTIGPGCINSGTMDYCADCAATDVRCVSGSTQVCGTDFHWGATTPCAVACVGSGNNSYCADCAASHTRCVGSDLQSCGSDQRWGTTTPCSLGCIDSGTADYCAVCNTGEARCVTGGRQVCGSDRRWGATMTCSLGCVDSGTADYCAVCNTGEAQCVTGGRQVCGSDRRWGATMTCSLGCVDSGTADYCAVCTPGETQCTSGGVQTCGADQRWGATMTCSLGCVDSGTADYCAVCDPGDARCVTGGRQVCGSDELWGATMTCSLGCVDSGTDDYCAECAVGTSECSGAGRRVCGTDELWGATMSCSLGCVDSGTDDYCAECDAGTSECSGAGRRVCGTDELWGATMSCALGCVDSGIDDYCAECVVGNAECYGGGRRVCGTDELWGGTMTCSLGCVDSGTDDYCAACTPGEVECQSGGLATCGDDSLWGAPASCTYGCLDETPDRCAECILDGDCTSGTCSAGTCI